MLEIPEINLDESDYKKTRRRKNFFNFNNPANITINYDESDFSFEELDETVSFIEIKKKVNKPNNPGIDISGSEPFRQGVEIRDSKNFFFNTNYKIHSGKRGHRISRENYGFEDSDIDFLVSHTPAFIEAEVYDPMGCVFLHQPEIRLLCVDSNDQSLYEHGQLKNVIEPLSIRPAASLMSPYINEPNMFWGNFCDGNLQMNRSSDRVIQVFVEGENGTLPFYDNDGLNSPGQDLVPLIVESPQEGARLKPFNDGDQHKVFYQKITGNITKITDQIIYGEDDYLGYDEKSCTTGFVYDNSSRGVDSIAFGGLM